MRKTTGRYTEEVRVSDLNFLKGSYIISNVRVLNPEATAFSPPQDVLITAGKIGQLSSDLDYPVGIKLINAQGKYLIPGLMDGHVHLTESRNSLWLNLVNGVTHVRDMGGQDYHLSVRDTRSGESLRPDVFVSSMKVYDTPWWQVWYMNWTRNRITMSHAGQADDIVRDSG